LWVSSQERGAGFRGKARGLVGYSTGRVPFPGVPAYDTRTDKSGLHRMAGFPFFRP